MAGVGCKGNSDLTLKRFTTGFDAYERRVEKQFNLFFQAIRHLGLNRNKNMMLGGIMVLMVLT